MKGDVADIQEQTEDNKDFRRVLYTGKHLQLVLMALRPGMEIGEEVHADHDQFFRIAKGKGEVWIDGERTNGWCQSNGYLFPSGRNFPNLDLALAHDDAPLGQGG